MDDQARRLAKTIFDFHRIHVDWRKHTWQQLSNLFQRLNICNSIRRKWGFEADWRTTDIPELRDIWDNGPQVQKG